MTQPLQAGSRRRIAAARFGAELRRAMKARQVGSKTLGRQADCAPSAIAMWLAGNNLPRLETAIRIAESLQWPKLIPLARAGRTDNCQRCGAAFLNQGGSPKRFCSEDCREVDAALREPPPGRVLAEAVRDELARVHGRSDTAIRRRPLAAALADYNRSDSKRQASVAAFCGGCEPAGVCRAPECELRPVSPLPLALSDKVGDVARKAEGVHGPTHRDAWLAASQAGNARRWARPGEREAQGSATAARFAAMSEEERAEHGRKVSQGRRRAQVAS